jgi:hypothetical protein
LIKDMIMTLSNLLDLASKNVTLRMFAAGSYGCENLFS